MYTYSHDRKKDVNIDSTPSFNRMNPSLTIWRVWRLRKRSTRSSGVSVPMLLTFCSPPMVRFPFTFGIIWILTALYIDKTIKLWKVFERNLKIVHETNLGENYGPLSAPVAKPFKPTKQLTLPKLVVHDTIIAAVPRRIYANGKEEIKRRKGSLLMTMTCSTCLSHQLDLCQLGWWNIHFSGWS